MAEKTGDKGKVMRPTETGICFKCQNCGREKPISEMRTVTRFVPMLIVCQDCARTLR
jgi:hypothetical protein